MRKSTRYLVSAIGWQMFAGFYLGYVLVKAAMGEWLSVGISIFAITATLSFVVVRYEQWADTRKNEHED